MSRKLFSHGLRNSEVRMFDRFDHSNRNLEDFLMIRFEVIFRFLDFSLVNLNIIKVAALMPKAIA